MDAQVKKIKQMLNIPDPTSREYYWELTKGESSIKFEVIQNEDFSFKLTQKAKNGNFKVDKDLYRAEPFAKCVFKVLGLISNQEKLGYSIKTKPDLFS